MNTNTGKVNIFRKILAKKAQSPVRNRLDSCI